jgi:hypothetical protein
MSEDVITLEKAKGAIESEKRARIERCSIRIAEILKEENCKLEIGMLITAQGNIPQLQVVSLN